MMMSSLGFATSRAVDSTSLRIIGLACSYTSPMRKTKLYKITFLSQGKSIELYAKHVASSALWGFTEVGELVFDPPGGHLVVDPVGERLREEFADTTTLHLPMHAIVRVEEVAKRGPLAIRDAASGDKIMPFPMPPPNQK